MDSTALKVALGCIVIRLAVNSLFPSLQQQLDQSVEFSTPVTSFRSLQEGIYLLRNNIQVYNHGVVHHPPILIFFLSLFNSDRLISLIYALIDGLIAYQLTEVTKAFKNLKLKVWLPGLLYAVNPLTLLSCISRSSIIFTNFAISSSLYCILAEGNVLLSSVMISISGYLSVYPILLLIPLLGMLKSWRQRILSAIVSILSLLILLLFSYSILGSQSWSFLTQVYGSIITFEKVFPNLGLWWYFFIEMFDTFIPFFKAVFNIFIAVFITPFTLRYHKQPFYAFILCIGWIVLTKPYPSLGDAGFFFSFLPFFTPLFGYLRYPIISALLFLHAIVLAPIFYHLWVVLGSGNSNFFYAISLVYALALASILVDLNWAMLRIEYDNGIPNFKLKVTQI
ncbi:GPI-anchor transamidase subunit gab1 [Saccharomyces cerevisiae]|nr:Gab1p [Saccharomyces cerevisiae YJM1387]CAI4650474.1 ADQ_G0039020.mRNA.1.CDS.1 [Saccharomyces cerevisiae]CAI4657479.1 CLN_G0039390.mRNA.1.CDS.1 [Saccharomyces cerevisiae]CAI6680428.1 CMF_HP1_G0039430.mRNA.1.CDS.1 [Saccharomyces cerevisiae]CAI6823116.1 ADQ_G0039020.mRNA.1.CDS.1 [Saccharomyces cerevisiae]